MLRAAASGAGAAGAAAAYVGVPEPAGRGGRTVVIDPGHQLGNHNFPAKINRLVPAGGFTQALQHDRDRDRRRLAGGDRRLAGLAGAASGGWSALGAHGRDDPHQQPAGPLGPVRRRARPARQPDRRRPQGQHPR